MTQKQKNTDGKTLEERFELSEQTAKELATENEKLKKELEKSRENNPRAKLFVSGVYKSAKSKATYGFKEGCVKVRKKDGTIVPSVEVLKDAETMEWLIKIGSSIIEKK